MYSEMGDSKHTGDVHSDTSDSNRFSTSPRFAAAAARAHAWVARGASLPAARGRAPGGAARLACARADRRRARRRLRGAEGQAPAPRNPSFSAPTVYSVPECLRSATTVSDTFWRRNIAPRSLRFWPPPFNASYAIGDGDRQAARGAAAERAERRRARSACGAAGPVAPARPRLGCRPGPRWTARCFSSRCRILCGGVRITISASTTNSLERPSDGSANRSRSSLSFRPRRR